MKLERTVLIWIVVTVAMFLAALFIFSQTLPALEIEGIQIPEPVSYKPGDEAYVNATFGQIRKAQWYFESYNELFVYSVKLEMVRIGWENQANAFLTANRRYDEDNKGLRAELDMRLKTIDEKTNIIELKENEINRVKKQVNILAGCLSGAGLVIIGGIIYGVVSASR